MDSEAARAEVKAIVKSAAADGVVFTAKQFGAIAEEAYAEMSAETTRQMYGAERRV